MERRPDYISKLALFLTDKEPLIYLFIINSDFVEDKEGKLLPPDSPAGVAYKNRRVIFIYNDKMMSSFSAKELYFIILHEAYHIFKKHLIRHINIKNHLMINIAEDMVINEEIVSSNYSYNFTPSCLKAVARIPENFKNEHKELKEDAYVTERVYHWLMNQKIEKRDLLKVGSYVKIKGTDKYGAITEELSRGNYKVSEMSKEEMLDEINYEKNNNNKNEKKYNEDELIPVVFGSKSGEGVPCDFEVESIGNIDKHFDISKEDKEDAEVFAKKIVKQAQEMEKHISKMAGNTSENFLSKIENLLKSKVAWRKELNKRLNVFYSESCGERGRKKSIINYPWNPKSRYGILCKHYIETMIKKQAYVIFAVDTSGSCFYDEYEIKAFFTEVEIIAKEFAYTKKGKVLTIQWDTKIVEGIKEYKRNDWKKYKVQGGGGTDPNCVFQYLNKLYKKENGWYNINENGIRFTIENKKRLPLLIFLTDGYFFNPITENTLGVYNNNKNNVLYFTRKADMIFPKENYIMYK